MTATTTGIPRRQGHAGASCEARPAAQFPKAERPAPLTKQQAVEEAIAAVFYANVAEVARRAIEAADAWDAAHCGKRGHHDA